MSKGNQIVILLWLLKKDDESATAGQVKNVRN